MPTVRTLGVCMGLWTVWLSLPHLPIAIADEAETFHREVEPLLRQHCYGCHSHASREIESGLALDWRSGWEKGGNRGPAVVPGNPDASLLIQAIRHTHPELRMPEDKLPQEAIERLVRWVADGAFDDRQASPANAFQDATAWWSLRPLERPAVPMTRSSNPIDAFILERLEANDLTPQAPAPRRDLLRRVMFDLIGLPPSPEQIDAFERDPDPRAYERWVDRLLASPQYGERWARHWLDTIHFADSHGFEHDVGRDHAWPYRDYVIRALNEDLPYDQFIREQLAVDYFEPTATARIPALGFLGAGTFDMSTFATAPVTFDYLDRDDLVTQTMATFTSTTANCARCHAHKFDPITQDDYYALQAVFSGMLKGDIPYDADDEIGKQRREWNTLLAAAQANDPRLADRPELREPVAHWVAMRNGGANWMPLDVDTFLSSDGATLTRSDGGVIVASGLAPEKDTYTVTVRGPLRNARAIRLEVLPDESLPMKGPGRCQNGNLHLSEVDIRSFAVGQPTGNSIRLSRATADFNQADWGIHRAIDGETSTAWGIYPAVGEAHHAVFEFAEPLTIPEDGTLSIVLRQMHGGSHLIGAFRLSVSSDEPARTEALPQEIETALKTPDDQRSTEQSIKLTSYAVRSIADAKLKTLPPPNQVYAGASSVMVPSGNGQYQSHALAHPKTVHVLHRGDFDKPRETIGPGALSVLAHAPARFSESVHANDSSRRGALAEWLSHGDNVLTWRSIVNRVWHYHFGRGLCDTPNDFGRMGGQPSHPELIDWLAIWFRDDARASLKSLHRLIVTSEAYQRGSANDLQSAEIDADNRFLWRQNRHRLDADSYRDFVGRVAGQWSDAMGGPGVRHFSESKGIQATPVLDYNAWRWEGAAGGRRSIYRHVWRGISDPFMESLDFPDLGLLAPTRGFSASPMQALALYNHDFVLTRSEQFARRLEHEAKDLPARIRLAVRLTWLREPSEQESVALCQHAEKHGLPAACRLLLNSNEFLFID